MPTTRTIDDARRMFAPMELFRRAGYDLMPLTEHCLPRDPGWPTADYSSFDAVTRLALGGAVGIRLRPTDLVVDVDPRSGGDLALFALYLELGIELDAPHVPKVITKRGGMHLFYRKPADLRTRVNLAAFPGIDFKRHVGFVVAAGSVHAKSGKAYVLAPGASPSAAPDAPAALLDLLTEPAREARPRGVGGEIDVDQLALLLAAVDPRAYGAGQYGKWIAMTAACHDATNGDGIDAWVDWCARDPDYADVGYELLEHTWHSFTAGRAGGATFRYLFKAVIEAGRYDLLKQLDLANDFLDEADIYDVAGADEENTDD